MAKLPLEGIRVIECTDIWIGPVTGHLLADMGAEVLKIEAIQRFSITRGTAIRPAPGPGYVDSDPGEQPWNRAASFNSMNRNKRAFTLDLTRPKGVELYKRLVGMSDVVVENYLPGVMTRLGVDYSALKEVKPDLVMVSMSLLGGTGPYRSYTSYGFACETFMGAALLRGYPDEDPGRVNPIYIGDPLGATRTVFAILSALHYRSRTGKGQYIDLSMAESLMPLIGEVYLDYTMNGRVARPVGNRDHSMAPHGCYRCQGEDNWVTIAVGSDEEFAALCRLLGRPELARDVRFADAISRHRNQDELDAIIGEWTAQRSDYEAMNLLQGAGVAAGVVTDAAKLLDDPHLKERGYFETIVHPQAGTHPYPGMPWKLSKTPGSIRTPPPCLGEHNDYVFGELLGLSKEEIAQLEEEQLIGTRYVEGADL